MDPYHFDTDPDQIGKMKDPASLDPGQIVCKIFGLILLPDTDPDPDEMIWIQ